MFEDLVIIPRAMNIFPRIFWCKDMNDKGKEALMQTQKFSMNTHDHQVISNHKSFVPGMFCTIQLGLHQFQILPILKYQVLSTTV